MKLYEITIEPVSGFGTTLKGDTLFGHFCWQAYHDSSIVDGGLDRWISPYEEKPFLVLSSAFPRLFGNCKGYALKRPDLPISRLFRDTASGDKIKQMSERKRQKKQRWMLVGEDLVLNLGSAEFVSDLMLVETSKHHLAGKNETHPSENPVPLVSSIDQPHNTINRQTMTTGEGRFAPFSEPVSFYYPGLQLAVFALIDEEATDIERVILALQRIGRWGYGKNASTGLGRFIIRQHRNIKLAPFGRAFDPGIFHSLSVTVRTTDKRHFDFSPLEFSEAKLEINDGLVDPHLTPAPGTAITVLLRRGAKGNILPLLKFHLCS